MRRDFTCLRRIHASRFEPSAPALAALVFGIGLFLATGFAWPSAIHNATHDTRHALGLPCH